MIAAGGFAQDKKDTVLLVTRDTVRVEKEVSLLKSAIVIQKTVLKLIRNRLLKSHSSLLLLVLIWV